MKPCVGKRCKKLSGRQVAGKPVWSIDGELHCQSCFDLWINAGNLVDQHRILRLSNDERDFELVGKIRRSPAELAAAR